MQQNPVYKEAIKTFEETQKAAVIAQMEQKEEIISQKNQLQDRLAMRKKKIEMKRSGLFGDSSMIVPKVPMSTKNAGFGFKN